MKNKEECIWRARELGVQYEIAYGGCAQSSFCAILDALREQDIHLIPSEQEEEIFKAFVSFPGGFGNSNEGTCGAVVGSAAAISMVVSCSREEQANDDGKNSRLAAYAVKTALLDPFVEKFGSIICRDLLLKQHGMSFCSQCPGRSKEFWESTNKIGCRTPENCLISNAADWSLRFILDYLDGKVDLNPVWDDFAPKAEQ